MKNNLNELNDILFDTIRSVQSGEMDASKANAIMGLSNNIINNAKTQLTAYKLTKGRAYKDTFLELPAPPSLKESDTYTKKNEFAFVKGYNNVTEAIEKMGKFKFENEFKDWIKKAKAK